VKTEGVRATLWVLVYLVVALSPLPLGLIQLDGTRGFVINFSVALGFVGLSMLGLQFVLAARIHRVNSPFGVGSVLQFHRQIAYVAVVLILLHPILLFVLNSSFLNLLNVFTSPLRAKFAVTSVVALLVLIAFSVWRSPLRLSYEAWQFLHSVLALLIVVTALLHALLIGYYISQPWEKALWIAMSVCFIGLGVWVRVVKPFQRWKRKWRVEEVVPELGNSYTVKLRPLDPSAFGPHGFAFRPGQFAWILTQESSPFALTYHPFSISSSAEDKQCVCFTIKAGGDFTRNIGKLQPGSIVYLDGPWGDFSMEQHEGPGFVFIAGGVGVTPMLSMLLTLADRGDRRPCYLFLGNQDMESITCRDEIEDLTSKLDLKVIHVLSHAGEDWTGETGRIDAERLDRYLPADRDRLQYFICGPPAMMDAVEDALAQLRIPVDRVHSERFVMV
jgi:predicted ferric reductase